jgi:hypothetical protein
MAAFMIGTAEPTGKGATPILDLPFLGSLYWPGFGHGNSLARNQPTLTAESMASFYAEGTTHAE